MNHYSIFTIALASLFFTVISTNMSLALSKDEVRWLETQLSNVIQNKYDKETTVIKTSIKNCELTVHSDIGKVATYTGETAELKRIVDLREIDPTFVEASPCHDNRYVQIIIRTKGGETAGNKLAMKSWRCCDEDGNWFESDEKLQVPKGEEYYVDFLYCLKGVSNKVIVLIKQLMKECADKYR